MHFKSYLKHCRVCPLQKACIKEPVKEHGRQVSFLLEALGNTNYLDLMKKKINSDQGKRDYAKRMWTVGLVFANTTSNIRYEKTGAKRQS